MRAQAARNLKDFATDCDPRLDLIPAEPGQRVGGNGKIRYGPFTRGRLVPDKLFTNLHPVRKPVLPKRLPGGRGVATEHLGQGERAIRQPITSREQGLPGRGRQGIEFGQQGLAARPTEQMPGIKPQVANG